MHTRKLTLPFLTLVFVLVWPVAAQATITHVQTKCTTGYGSATLSSGNLTSNVPSGRLLIVYAVDINGTYGDNDLTSISDTLGTSYTQIHASVNTGSSPGTSLELWYGVTSNSGTNSVSTTWSRSVVNGEVCVVEVSGATVVDASQNSNNASNGGDLVSNSFSTNGNERYVIWGVAQNGVNSFSAGSDFTLINGTGIIGLEYRITSSTLTNYVAHITSGSGAGYEGDIVAFEAGGSPPSGSEWTTSGSTIYNSNSGNVGIGTTSPSSKLQVAGDVTATGNVAAGGNISATGNISARYQDLAEWVPAERPIGPGFVVIVDPGAHNSVSPSTVAYDTRVAGVVSAQPGIVLGEAGEDKVKVATTGRVKVRVDASHHPIAIGDLLVTSDREGMAMKSEPIDVGEAKFHRPGTLIGKALEPLAEGEGEILVLLSLQ